MSYSAVRIPATRTPSASIIFLHGLGDSGSGWAFLAEEARRQKRLQHVNFVFPNAPTRPVTLNFGMAMPAWYDIPSLGAIRSNQDEKGILESIETLKNLIKEQQDKGIPLNRIVIGGFSQGCAVSLATSVLFDRKLAGIVGLSGYLPIAESLVPSEVNKNTPVFLGHGTEDNVVTFDKGEASRDALIKTFGFKNVSWNAYPDMLHSVSPKELVDLFEFLESTIPEEPANI